MFKIIAITNRNLCKGDFLKQIEKIARAGVSAIILREKELSKKEYALLAEKVEKICRNDSVEFICHKHLAVAEEKKYRTIHVPMQQWKEEKGQQSDFQKGFDKIGTSVHSVTEAIEAEKMGAHYILAGHIFQTNCKKDLEPRGTAFLKEVVQAVSIPVYAVGGIQEKNIQEVQQTGAAGACIMSGFMQAESPEKMVKMLTESWNNCILKENSASRQNLIFD